MTPVVQIVALWIVSSIVAGAALAGLAHWLDRRERRRRQMRRPGYLRLVPSPAERPYDQEKAA